VQFTADVNQSASDIIISERRTQDATARINKPCAAVRNIYLRSVKTMTCASCKKTIFLPFAGSRRKLELNSNETNSFSTIFFKFLGNGPNI